MRSAVAADGHDPFAVRRKDRRIEGAQRAPQLNAAHGHGAKEHGDADQDQQRDQNWCGYLKQFIAYAAVPSTAWSATITARSESTEKKPPSIWTEKRDSEIGSISRSPAASTDSIGT